MRDFFCKEAIRAAPVYITCKKTDAEPVNFAAVMKIIIDTNLLSRKPVSGYAFFIYQLLQFFINKHPGDDFILVSCLPGISGFVFDEKVKTIVTGPEITNRIQHKYWYDIKVPLLLKKHKADIFVSPEGYCSFYTRVPQCILLPDLFFSKRTMRKTLEKANSIIIFTQFSKAAILSNYTAKEEKLHIINCVAGDLFHPLGEYEKNEVKTQYTGGKNYFIYADDVLPLKNLTDLLRAFSVFKKRQKTDWKLVLTSTGMDKKFMENLRSYKYRDDIVIVVLKEKQQLASLLGAAYAMVYPSVFAGQYIPLLQAMNCGIPIITPRDAAWEEITGGAALYADTASHLNLADKMMLLYKDEVLRSQLINKGKEISAANNMEAAATLFGEGIGKARK